METKKVKNAIKIAEEFNSKILDFISKIKNKDINEYRDKLNKLLK